VRYEGYGPGGVAVIADCLTDNRNRTAPEMRTIFGKYDGNLGASGCVAYMFEPRGLITIDAADAPGEDRLMELALEAGAEDVELDDGVWTIATAPGNLLQVKESLEEAGLKLASSEQTMLPQNTVAVAGRDAERVLALMEALDDHDDVQKVYANFDLVEEPTG